MTAPVISAVLPAEGAPPAPPLAAEAARAASLASSLALFLADIAGVACVVWTRPNTPAGSADTCCCCLASCLAPLRGICDGGTPRTLE